MSAFEENALSEVEQNINARTPLSSTPLDTSAKQKQRIEIDPEDLRLAKLLQAQELAYASFLGQPEDMPDADNDNWMYGLTDDEIAARLQAQEDEWASPSYEPTHQHSITFDESIQEAEADESYEQLTALGELAGKVSKGASDAQLSALQRSSHIPGNENVLCSICRCDFEQGEDVATLPCKHAYHEPCIKSWLVDNKTCCLCWKELPEPEPQS